MEVLNDYHKSVKGSRILLLGLAYKSNVDDDRESPSYRLMEKLEELGATVSYNDPYIPVIRMTREYAKFAGRTSAAISANFDLIIIVTAHDEYKTLDVQNLQVPILDTRNTLRQPHPMLYKA
jgi:UDP-N-acetyl-D-glucosamine dehydrogenase